MNQEKAHSTKETGPSTYVAKVKKSTEGHPRKMGPKGLTRGAAAPLVSPPNGNTIAGVI